VLVALSKTGYCP